ncbi:MAG: enoyl-CoA hydratase/isomerase family protein [Acidimicrobiales bacterium]
MSQIGEASVLCEERGPVLTATINSPERHNALTWEAISALRALMARARQAPEVRVVVVTGAGERAFCAGADLSSMASTTPRAATTLSGDTALSGDAAVSDPFVSRHEARGELALLFEDLWALGKPVVAKVRGYALGGGFGLALACDLVYAADDAVFGAPEIDVGIWPYMITVPLQRAMQPKQALELMLTARRVGAAEGLAMGFVNKVTAPAELDAAVEDVAAVLAAKPPVALRLGRGSFYRAWGRPAGDALAALHAELTVAATTEEAREGIAAFQEKRAPSWRPTEAPGGGQPRNGAPGDGPPEEREIDA